MEIRLPLGEVSRSLARTRAAMRSFILLLAVSSLVGAVAACTTTYTETDLTAIELKEDADAEDEEKRDREIAEEGGTNREAMRDEELEVDRESEL